MNILQVNNKIGQGDVLKKQKYEKIAALMSLKSSNEKDELKQTEIIFLQNLMNDLIHTKLNETINLQIIIKTDELNYKLKYRKVYAFIEYFSPIANLSDLHIIYLSWKDADDKQCSFSAKIKGLDKGKNINKAECFK